MAYCTQADVLARLGSTALIELTSDSGSSVVYAIVDDAIERAHAAMDADIGYRYAVPVDVTGDTSLAATLRALALDLVDFFLHQRRGLVSGAKQKLYDHVKAWLADVRSGVHPLPAASGTPASATADPPAIEVNSATRAASRENMEDL